MSTTCGPGDSLQPPCRPTPKAAELVEVADSIADIRVMLNKRRGRGQVGLVPTMGALHAGHVRLFETARRECDTLVVSIFVNPLQFDRADDLSSYPRQLEQDLRVCETAGVDLVFAPVPGEMYPRPVSCAVDIGRLADHLCGKYRPGHFRGVATIVLKLLNIIQPTRAYFGEKDAQQLAIIRRVVGDLNVPVEVVPVATVREEDGLALSSRNRRLTGPERNLAPSLYRALQTGCSMISAGETDSAAVTSKAMTQIPEDVRLEYLEIVDPEGLQPVTRIDRPVLIAGAVWIGQTRLIDNLFCTRT
jgi:pantoate--beta-alanine ligase